MPPGNPNIREDSRATQFKKGQVGNPRGRPVLIKHIRDLCRNFSEEVLQTMLEILRDKNAPPSARVAAGNAIWDRAWGKPLQAMDVRLNLNDVRIMTDAELLELIGERKTETIDIRPGPGALPAPENSSELN